MYQHLQETPRWSYWQQQIAVHESYMHYLKLVERIKSINTLKRHLARQRFYQDVLLPAFRRDKERKRIKSFQPMPIV